MDNKKVTVLTPNGRRQNITISPSTTILQILDIVCAKYGFNCEEYDLKHHNTILDPSAMFRYAGLPNNCFLEMIEIARKRDNEKEVLLCIQLENGSRRQGTFQPSENLMNILQNLCEDKIGPQKHPVFIYMRKEIFGNELKKATLKSLGINGRAMIRLIDRNPEELRKQANVYVPFTKDSVSKPDETSKKTEEEKEKPTPPDIHLSVEEKSTPILKAVPANHSFQITPDQVKAIKVNKEEVPKSPKEKESDLMQTDIPGPSKKTEYDWGTGGRTINEKMEELEKNIDFEEEDEEMQEEPQIIELGERNAVIFSLAQAQRVVDDLPDSFFELTTDDLKLILKDLRAQATGSDDEPLLTSKLREMQEQSKILTKMGKYKKSVIRVQFPDRLVLQGTFHSTETLKDVYEFIRGYLNDSNINFHLFTTPPKLVPDTGKTLIELDFLPAIVLHFGVDNASQSKESFLKPELLTKLSSPNGATIAASKSRGQISKLVQLKHSTVTEAPQISKGAIPKKPKPDNFRESSSSAGSPGQVPKWFKPIKK